ncbi:MAG: transcriptional regulator [Ruminococcus sp.]|nr:transcriptional regulator [Ruminococcus sp.]
MKLIYAIVNNDDSHQVMDAITESGFQATKLASTGGFLKAGNTTFILAVDDCKVDKVIEVIRAHSKKRTQMLPATPSIRTSSFASFPAEISIGGATIIVTDIDRFEKL